jgi:hypothetical protein
MTAIIPLVEEGGSCCTPPALQAAV